MYRVVRPWWTRLRIMRLLCYLRRHVYLVMGNPTGVGLGFCLHCGEYFGG